MTSEKPKLTAGELLARVDPHWRDRIAARTARPSEIISRFDEARRSGATAPPLTGRTMTFRFDEADGSEATTPASRFGEQVNLRIHELQMRSLGSPEREEIQYGSKRTHAISKEELASPDGEHEELPSATQSKRSAASTPRFSEAPEAVTPLPPQDESEAQPVAPLPRQEESHVARFAQEERNRPGTPPSTSTVPQDEENGVTPPPPAAVDWDMVTFAIFNFFDNGPERQKGKVRYKVKVQLWDTANVNLRGAHEKRWFRLSSLRSVRDAAENLEGRAKSVADIVIAQVEVARKNALLNRMPGEPQAMCGWIENYSHGTGTNRDCKQMIVVTWELDTDECLWLPTFEVVTFDQDPISVKGQPNRVGSKKALFVGFLDRIGYYKFRGKK